VRQDAGASHRPEALQPVGATARVARLPESDRPWERTWALGQARVQQDKAFAQERDVYKCAPCTLSTLSLSQGAVTLGAECRPFASADRCCGFPQAVGSQQGSIFRGGAGRSQLFVRGAQRLTSALRVRYRLANTVTVDWPLDRALRSALGRPDIPGARGEQGVHRAGL